MTGNEIVFHAIDVAFHENGLSYGSRQDTVIKVIMKFIRTAMCMVGYFGVDKRELIFASPKIGKLIMADLQPCIADFDAILCDFGYSFSMRIIANDEFNDFILKPIFSVSEGVADTSELFMRSYQLTKMFDKQPAK